MDQYRKQNVHFVPHNFEVNENILSVAVAGSFMLAQLRKLHKFASPHDMVQLMRIMQRRIPTRSHI